LLRLLKEQTRYKHFHTTGHPLMRSIELGEQRALEKGCPDLPFQLAFAPTFLHRHSQVELAFLRQFALAENLQVV
jgi:hypothetical protein